MATMTATDVTVVADTIEEFTQLVELALTAQGIVNVRADEATLTIVFDLNSTG